MSRAILCYVGEENAVLSKFALLLNCGTTNTLGNLNVLSVYRYEISLKRKTIFLQEVVNKVNVLSMSFSPKLLTSFYTVLQV